VAVAAGCGGGSASSQAQPSTSPTARGGPAESEAPKGASPLLREIYRQFPKPRPSTEAKGSAKAARAGERACAGKTPLQVREEFAAKAKLSAEQEKTVAQLPAFEKSSTKSADYVAGQVGALVYESTLSAKAASPGYQGCVYSLARGLERKLASSKGSGT